MNLTDFIFVDDIPPKKIRKKQTPRGKEEKKQEITISDHAMVRYLERVKGIDIEEIRKEILTENVLDLIKTLGDNGSYPNKNFKLVVRNKNVVTITV